MKTGLRGSPRSALPAACLHLGLGSAAVTRCGESSSCAMPLPPLCFCSRGSLCLGHLPAPGHALTHSYTHTYPPTLGWTDFHDSFKTWLWHQFPREVPPTSLSHPQGLQIMPPLSPRPRAYPPVLYHTLLLGVSVLHHSKRPFESLCYTQNQHSWASPAPPETLRGPCLYR